MLVARAGIRVRRQGTGATSASRRQSVSRRARGFSMQRHVSCHISIRMIGIGVSLLSVRASDNVRRPSRSRSREAGVQFRPTAACTCHATTLRRDRQTALPSAAGHLAEVACAIPSSAFSVGFLFGSEACR